MTLRTDYFDGATGLQQQLADAFTAGGTFVTANLTALSQGLKDNAALGKTTFTVNVPTTFAPTALRLNGLIQRAYFAGITSQLAVQVIYSFECVPVLNTTDLASLSVDFRFTFQTT